MKLVAPSFPSSDSTASAHESGRRFGLRDGIFQATTQGAGEQYLSAFALMLQATPFHLSVLSALPQLLGTWAQFVSVKMSHWFPHRTSQVRWGIIGQSLAWLPMLGLPLLFPQWGPWLVVAGAALPLVVLGRIDARLREQFAHQFAIGSFEGAHEGALFRPAFPDDFLALGGAVVAGHPVLLFSQDLLHEVCDE